jgi:D-sedoheptulose 7-phosphate isomerase
MKERIETIIRETAALHEALVDSAEPIESVARLIIQALGAGRSLYVMGNGGSAADAQHLAGELVGRFEMERRPLPCLALTTDTSVLTAVINDYSVEQVFVKQVQAFAREGDVVMGISTSGNSANINRALEEARRIGAATVGLSGRTGGQMVALCDAVICVPADHTPRIQEAHQTIIHIICHLVESELFG